jgi:IMP dehydrogenase
VESGYDQQWGISDVMQPCRRLDQLGGVPQLIGQSTRNAARYRQGTTLVFEEGVDGYVPYAGSLYGNVGVSLAKITSTMVSCGSTTLRQFHDSAKLVEVSRQSYLQDTEDVRLRDQASARS